MISSFWPLVAFTLFVQMGAGAFIVAEAVHLTVSGRINIQRWRTARLFTRIAIFACSTIALVLASFHLGNPSRAFYALRNLRTSWLSREILLLLVFLFLTAVCALLSLRRKGPLPILQLPVFAAGVTGLLLIGAMSAVYMLPAVPAWKSFLTPASFLFTTFLLGTQLSAAVLAIHFRSLPNSFSDDIRSFWNLHILIRLEILSLGLAVFAVLASTLLFIQFGSQASPSEPWVLDARDALPIFTIRMVLSLIGALFLIKGIFLLRRERQTAPQRLIFVCAGFLVLFLAEVFGRCLFFSVYYRLGI